MTTPSNGAFTFGVAEIDLGLRGVDLRLLELLGGIAVGSGIVERGFRGDGARRKIGLALVFQPVCFIVARAAASAALA